MTDKDKEEQNEESCSKSTNDKLESTMETDSNQRETIDEVENKISKILNNKNVKCEGKTDNLKVADKEKQKDCIKTSDETAAYESSISFLMKEKNSYLEMDTQFIRFLSNYVDDQRYKNSQKMDLKYVFFGIIMLGFIVLICAPIILILFKKSFESTEFIITLISLAIELLSAIIILPKIIAEYLFNKEEDKNMIEIIRGMQDYNEKKHNYFDNEK